MRWIASRAIEMYHVGKIAIDGQPLTVAQLRQTQDIVERFRRRFKNEKGRADLGSVKVQWDHDLDMAIGFQVGDAPEFWKSIAE